MRIFKTANCCLDDFAAIQLSEDMKENIRKVFVYMADIFRVSNPME